MEELEDEICPQCGHEAYLHFGNEGYGCDDCPSKECGLELGSVDVVLVSE